MTSNLKSSEVATKVFLITSLRCEYVGDLAPILNEIEMSHAKGLPPLVRAYSRAKKKGTLRKGLDPRAMSFDTMSFFEGVLRLIAYEADDGHLTNNVHTIFRHHIALRRTSFCSSICGRF